MSFSFFHNFLWVGPALGLIQTKLTIKLGLPLFFAIWHHIFFPGFLTIVTDEISSSLMPSLEPHIFFQATFCSSDFHQKWYILCSLKLLMLSSFDRVRLFVTLGTVACGVLLSMEFSRQEYWSGLPFAASGDLTDPGIKPSSLMSPALASRFFATSTTWEALIGDLVTNMW